MSRSTQSISVVATEIAKDGHVTFLDDVQLSDGLLSGSIANAAVIACSDMGAWIPFVCSSPTAKVFLFQNFGHTFDKAGMLETVLENDLSDVVVYGHSDCQFLKHLAANANDSNQSDLSDLYAAALASNSETAWAAVGRYKVLNELKLMLSDPILGALSATGKLKLHGWFYREAAEQLEVFDPNHKAFLAVTK